MLEKTAASTKGQDEAFAAPFFIFGCGRSGTSLLSRMLNEHSRLAVPYESHLFNTFFHLLPHYGDLGEVSNRMRLVNDILRTDVMKDWEPRLDADSVLGNIENYSFGGVFDAVMRSWADKNGKVRWGEKTPQHVYYWDQIHKAWPDAKAIHIYRDGRDVALSLLRARFGPKTVYANAKYWVRYLEAVNDLTEKIDDDRIIEVSYENLLEDPERELRKVCDFLGEAFEANMLEFYKNRAEYRTDIKNRENLQRPVIRNNKDKWRKEMSRNDIRIFEAIAEGVLAKLGYPLENKNARMSFWEHLFYGTVLSPFKKAVAMVRNRKGHKDFWIRLMIRINLVLR